MADISTGLYSALSILALLYSRDAQSTPREHGNTIGLSLLDTMTELMGYPLTYTRYSGIDQEALGMSSPAVAPYGAYRTADGQTVVLGTTNDAEWQRLSRQIIRRDDLADDARLAHNSGRCAHRGILDEAIGAFERRRSSVGQTSKIANLHFPGREPLTRREREVLEHFSSGASNKEAGRLLGISPRTIEYHRANIMKKLGAKNATDLIRTVLTAAGDT